MATKKSNEEKCTEVYLTAPVEEVKRILRIGRTILAHRETPTKKPVGRPRGTGSKKRGLPTATVTASVTTVAGQHVPVSGPAKP